MQLSQSNSWFSCSQCCEITDKSPLFLLMSILCLCNRVFRHLFVCPTYEALQSLQFILYTTSQHSFNSNLSLPVFMYSLSLFGIVCAICRFDFFKRVIRLSGIFLRKGIVKNFFLSLFDVSVVLVFFKIQFFILLLIVWKINSMGYPFLRNKLMVSVKFFVWYFGCVSFNILSVRPITTPLVCVMG